MDRGDYSTRVEPYRHGIKHGSNYLFLDLHVGLFKPKKNPDGTDATLVGIDPWDVPIDDANKGDKP
jgi:prepilin-type processing-associated H-X9-DG protein